MPVLAKFQSFVFKFPTDQLSVGTSLAPSAVIPGASICFNFSPTIGDRLLLILIPALSGGGTQPRRRRRSTVAGVRPNQDWVKRVPKKSW